MALISTVPERVAPLLAALAFDAQLSFGMRLEVRVWGDEWMEAAVWCGWDVRFVIVSRLHPHTYIQPTQVLDLLMEGAQDLSQLRPTHALMAATANSNQGGSLLADAGPRVQGKRALVVGVAAASSQMNQQQQQPAEGATALAEAKTRRWGYRRGRAPLPARNRFGPVAARAFFRPLVHGLWRHGG